MTTATVILFKPSGKYYTEEPWRIPTLDQVVAAGGNLGDSVIPYCMRFSPDFRTIDGGAVLIETQEPWGYPHLIPQAPARARASVNAETARTTRSTR